MLLLIIISYNNMFNMASSASLMSAPKINSPICLQNMYSSHKYIENNICLLNPLYSSQSDFLMASPNLLSPPQNSSTIKELSSSGVLSSLPSLYASKAHELEPVVEDGQIPVVDFSLLTAGSPEKRSQMIRELGKACEDWGFFMLVNHGVPEKLREGMMDALKGFFNRTEEEKKEYADTHVLNPIPIWDQLQYSKGRYKVLEGLP